MFCTICLDFSHQGCKSKLMSDSQDLLRYDRMVEGALRGVVREAIEEVMENGLPGEHHFYITFLTDYPGVEIPDYLRERYPGEMTIVLQYQFYDLEVDENSLLRVTLSFNNQPEKLVIPLAAISIFADPSVNFALQFQPVNENMEDSLLDALEELEEDDEGPDDDGAPKGAKGKSDKKKKSSSKSDGESGQVISLDQFRKK